MTMTYKEALEAGYELADQKFFKGYISRKTDILSQPVCVAGGSRKGQLYVELPCFISTIYAIKQYLVKKNSKPLSSLPPSGIEIG